jgi:hypothetical protein
LAKLSRLFAFVCPFLLLPLAGAKTDLEECANGMRGAHAAFLSEVLAINGHFPQMEAGIRTKVLSYLLQRLSTPLAKTVLPVSDHDITAAAKYMDRIHLAMGVGALSYLRIDEDMRVPMDVRFVHPSPGEAARLAGKIRGVDLDQSVQYIQTLFQKRRVDFDGTVVHLVSELRLRRLLTNASFAGLSNVVQAIRCLTPADELSLAVVSISYRGLTSATLPEAAATIDRFIQTKPDLAEKLKRFGIALGRIYEDEGLRTLATEYRKELQERGRRGRINAYHIQNAMEPLIIAQMAREFPDMPAEKIRSCIEATNIFIP